MSDVFLNIFDSSVPEERRFIQAIKERDLEVAEGALLNMRVPLRGSAFAHKVLEVAMETKDLEVVKLVLRMRPDITAPYSRQRK